MLCHVAVPIRNTDAASTISADEVTSRLDAGNEDWHPRLSPGRPTLLTDHHWVRSADVSMPVCAGKADEVAIELRGNRSAALSQPAKGPLRVRVVPEPALKPTEDALPERLCLGPSNRDDYAPLLAVAPEDHDRPAIAVDLPLSHALSSTRDLGRLLGFLPVGKAPSGRWRTQLRVRWGQQSNLITLLRPAMPGAPKAASSATRRCCSSIKAARSPGAPVADAHRDRFVRQKFRTQAL